jgi:SAM-dependent methyltransferase
LDWGAGYYERTAEQLLPAARVVVERAAIRQGERVVDVGCGTGNAALLAAAQGASVIGVDPAPRLIEVARSAASGLDAEFVEGEAAALPLEDASVDVVLSVFGVIFASDAAAAAAEMTRVLHGNGRIVLSAWIPDGAISQTVRASREAMARALGTPPGPPPFAWHDHDALTGLLAPHGFKELSLREERISFGGESVDAFLEAELENHPLAVAGRAVLEPRGELHPLRERQRKILTAANEDPNGFRVTSRYVVATAGRG